MELESLQQTLRERLYVVPGDTYICLSTRPAKNEAELRTLKLHFLQVLRLQKYSASDSQKHDIAFHSIQIASTCSIRLDPYRIIPIQIFRVRVPDALRYVDDRGLLGVLRWDGGRHWRLRGIHIAIRTGTTSSHLRTCFGFAGNPRVRSRVRVALQPRELVLKTMSMVLTRVPPLIQLLHFPEVVSTESNCPKPVLGVRVIA